MTDLSTLLHESAPAPRRPLDLAAVHDRARRAGARRRLLWLGGLGSLLALPIGAGTFVPAHEGADGRVDAGRKRPAVVAPDDSSAADGTALAVAADAGKATGVGGSVRHSPPTATSAASSVGDPLMDAIEVVPVVDGATAVDASYPTAAACSVDDVGLAPRDERRCRFTASALGGASFRSNGPTSPVGASGRVLVTRNGETTTYEVRHSVVRVGEVRTVYCGAYIEPGDLVEVVLTVEDVPDDGTTVTLGAGEGWECWNGG